MFSLIATTFAFEQSKCANLGIFAFRNPRSNKFGGYNAGCYKLGLDRVVDYGWSLFGNQG